MIFPSLTLLLLPLTLAKSAAQQPLQVYLYPTPAAPSLVNQAHASVPTLSADQAKAVLGHHLREGLADFEEIPQDEGMWSHLMGLWNGEQGEGRPKIVVIDGGVDAQDVLPTSLPKRPAFYLEDDTSTDFLLEPYLNEAKNLLAHILDAIPALTKTFKDVFDMAGTKAAAVLSHELSCLTALADSIPWLDHSGQYPWEAITITGLKDVQRDDEVWETGRQGVKAGLEAMTTPNSPPLLLIIRPTSTRSLISRAAPVALKSKSNVTLAEACYTSNETCSDATGCNGRGVCSLRGKTSDGECWGCKCRSGYAGVECQKDDYSIPFIILVFSTVLLVSLTVGSIALLSSIGDTKLPSTLTLAIGGTMKRD
ncbi:hypothetical protein CI109_101738 [Kwoniella shandongensis]|uniref:Vacuolar sorting protein Vps3844 C-terminal domain-containing protein n=1 Tax=Kwoniella shandongensis TaxID=1734106 RepID=A0A5M6C5D2_9TREE|nr:uncharacterized protein CI109_001139 [Kwoniella shandongensis]KAA5530338.1 hypothetical protein CI109_001139 [Kwoniella shandongensis]